VHTEYQFQCYKPINPDLSASSTNTNDNTNAITDARIHIKKNFFTSVLLNIFLGPSFATPIPNIAATFNCTNDVGIPLVSDANSSRLAEIKAIIPASNFPNRMISLPVFRQIL